MLRSPSATNPSTGARYARCMTPLMFMLALVLLDVLALRWGVDSRELDPSLPPRRAI